MRPEEYEAEVARLHAFAMQLAQRLAAASEVLSIRAERKDKRAIETPRRDTSDREEKVS